MTILSFITADQWIQIEIQSSLTFVIIFVKSVVFYIKESDDAPLELSKSIFKFSHISKQNLTQGLRGNEDGFTKKIDTIALAQ